MMYCIDVYRQFIDIILIPDGITTEPCDVGIGQRNRGFIVDGNEDVISRSSMKELKQNTAEGVTHEWKINKWTSGQATSLRC